MFADHISKFIQWWDFMEIETDPQIGQGNNLTYYFDSLANADVVLKWNMVKVQYAAYTAMVREVDYRCISGNSR
jgi:hypothetical protein